MRKLACSLSVLFFHFCLSAQKIASDGDSHAPLNIPGTHLSIIPPLGFKLSNEFKGLQKSNDIYIKVIDPLNNNFLKYSRSFTRESLENGGTEVLDFKKLNVSGFQAKYASVQGNTGAKSFYLVFGDSSFSTMIAASCPANKDSTMAQLKEALLSATYNVNLKVDPFAGTFFKLNDDNADYKFAKFKSDCYYYSEHGINKEDFSGDSYLIAYPFTSDYSVGSQTIIYAIREVDRQMGITDSKIKKEQQITLGKETATETELTAKENDKKVEIYRLTIVHGTKAVLIMGIANADFEKNMASFKTLANTVVFK